MPYSAAAAIDAAELVKTYPAGRHAPPVRALDGMSINVAPGTVFGLLGRNGAGKSTTVKILTTLSRPDSGTARVAGINALAEPGRVRAAIGLVSQKPSGIPMATGRENLVLAARLQGMTRADASRRAAELLDRFGLGPAADRLAKTYSGGMARKLDVAIGLVHRPQVLFLDEPTTGLDPEARAEMWTEIDRLAGDEQMTVLLTTHYLEEADRLADRLAIIDAGKIVVEGTAEQLKSELRGDTVHVELADNRAAPIAADVLARAGLREVTADGTRLRGRADSGARAVPSLLSALEDGGLVVASVTVARPSLDDVYLRHLGRAYEEVA
jgi:ABC-2 type transport system ATP-binding protein